MERITVEIAWTAPDGTLDDLENEGGDVTLAEAALAAAKAYRDGAKNDAVVSSYRDEA